MIYEVTITANQLCVRILFNDVPNIQNVIDASKIIFQKDSHVAEGLEDLLSDIAPFEESLFESGEAIEISTKDEQRAGSMYLQTRTLFDILI